MVLLEALIKILHLFVPQGFCLTKSKDFLDHWLKEFESMFLKIALCLVLS